MLLALIRSDRASTVTELQHATRLARSTVYESLLWLRENGLVAWEPHLHGTIRARVQEVQYTRPRRRRASTRGGNR